MKKVFVILISLFSASMCIGQNDTSKVEQYCQLIATPKLLSNKVTIDIDFGDEKSFWRDTRLTSYNGRLKKFNTIVDALNFMGRDGWKFISVFPVHIGNTEILHFGFRKEFASSDIQFNQ